MVEAVRRSKFKFSGRQKIFVSKKFGFTKWGREVSEEPEVPTGFLRSADITRWPVEQ
jgi:hypothetical protein